MNQLIKKLINPPRLKGLSITGAIVITGLLTITGILTVTIINLILGSIFKLLNVVY